MNVGKKTLSVCLLAVLLGAAPSTWAADPMIKCGNVVNKLLFDFMKQSSFALKIGCKKGDAAAYAAATQKVNKAIARFNKRAAKVDVASCDADAVNIINQAPVAAVIQSQTREFVADALNNGNPFPADAFCNGVDD